MKAEQAVEQNNLHLLAADSSSSAQPGPSFGPVSKARETAAAAEAFKTSPEPINVAAAAFVERLAQRTAPSFTAGPSDRFLWDAEKNPDVVCPAQRSIAIYTNAYGQAVIREEMSYDGDDDTWICVSVANLPDVIGRLQAILDQAD